MQASDFFGVLVAVASLAVLLTSVCLRTDRRTLLAAWTSVLLHHFISWLNAFLFTVPGAEGDASDFHLAALWTGSWPHQQYLYTKFLGLVYEIFGPSKFLGQSVSILAFSVSLIVFCEMIDLLELEDYKLGLVLWFGLLPGPLIHTSLTLREPFQALFFLLAACQFLKMRLGKETLATYVVLTGSLFFLATLHNGLAVYVVLWSPLAFLWAQRGRRELGLLLAITMLASAPLMAPRIVESMSEKSQALASLASGEALEYASEYRSWAVEGRATYNVTLDATSPIGLLVSLPAVFLAYLFMPLPWQASSPLDVYAFGEACLRAALLWGTYRRLTARTKVDGVGFLLVTWLSLELLWSMGNFNWGQAIRHHTIAYGCLLLVGLPSLLERDKFGDRSVLVRRRASRARRISGE